MAVVLETTYETSTISSSLLCEESPSPLRTYSDLSSIVSSSYHTLSMAVVLETTYETSQHRLHNIVFTIM